MIYPELPVGLGDVLAAIEFKLKVDKGFLDREGCPYDEKTRVYLRKLVGGVDGGVGEAVDWGGDDLPVIESEIKRAITEMNRLFSTVQNLETSEKIQLLKAHSALLERLVAMNERVYNVKEISEFMRTMMTFMKEILSKDQIEMLRERVKNVGILMAGDVNNGT